MSLLPTREKVAAGRMRGRASCRRSAPLNPHPLGSRPRDPSDLSRPRDEVTTRMSLLPSAGEGGRRPDEGAAPCAARPLNPHPLGSRPRDPSDLSRPRAR